MGSIRSNIFSGMPFKPDPIHIENKGSYFDWVLEGNFSLTKNMMDQYGHALTNHIIQSSQYHYYGSINENSN
ncbi:hypothetical protein F8M41_025146 [Gigaspora margarita]|uniref:Uncharacterized protein n=1 Tax=Gigaspora margarita TaxID=4874 RepID=A0A8H4ABP8_GIGMA|nr:hypothetical protein F8M41_025146 [Gigaspora margarita]